MKDETVLFTAAISSVPLCFRCASMKSEIDEDRLASVVQQVQQMITVIEHVDECDSCGRRTAVYRLRWKTPTRAEYEIR